MDRFTEQDLDKMTRDEVYKLFRAKILACKNCAEEVEMYKHDEEYLMLKRHLLRGNEGVKREIAGETKKVLSDILNKIDKENMRFFRAIEEQEKGLDAEKLYFNKGVCVGLQEASFAILEYCENALGMTEKEAIALKVWNAPSV